MTHESSTRWDRANCTHRVAVAVNTLRPRQNGRHFVDDTFKRIFANENARISIKISLKFVPKSPIDDISALFQIVAWRCPGDKPLSEPMMVSLTTHICVTRPQWVKWKMCNTVVPSRVLNWYDLVSSWKTWLLFWIHHFRMKVCHGW